MKVSARKLMEIADKRNLPQALEYDPEKVQLLQEGDDDDLHISSELS
jgi:hypothetical protein